MEKRRLEKSGEGKPNKGLVVSKWTEEKKDEASIKRVIYIWKCLAESLEYIGPYFCVNVYVRADCDCSFKE